MPWIALALLAALAWEDLLDNPHGFPLWWFAVPVLLAILSIIVAVREARILDIVVSALVIIAIPVWFAALVVLLHLVTLKGSDWQL